MDTNEYQSLKPTFDNAWDDNPNATDLSWTDADLETCAQKLKDFALSHLMETHLAAEDLFALPVPVTVHPLLAARYANEYTLESRDAMFDALSEKLDTLFDAEAITNCMKSLKLTYIKPSDNPLEDPMGTPEATDWSLTDEVFDPTNEVRSVELTIGFKIE